MKLHTERLRLSPVSIFDLDDLFRIYSDPATNTFNPAGPCKDMAEANAILSRWLNYWEQDGFGHWTISSRNEPNRIIGFGGLSVRNCADVVINNLGYRFATEAWGKGYATELSQFAIKYGFTQLKLQDISATVRPDHIISQNVLKKSGFRYIRDIQDVDNMPPSQLFTITFDEWNVIYLSNIQ